MTKYAHPLYVYGAELAAEVNPGGVVVSDSSDTYHLTPDEARAFARDLVQAAGEADGHRHRCHPEGDPMQLPMGSRWTCPEDGIEWYSSKRMINREMVGLWQPVRSRLRTFHSLRRTITGGSPPPIPPESPRRPAPHEAPPA